MSWFEPVLTIAGAVGQRTPLRIAQLTDCHLLIDQQLYEGIDSLANLHRVLATIQHQRYDLVVITGDVTQDHTLASYQLLFDACQQYLPQTTVAWLPGNHDDIADMSQVLSATPLTAAKHIQLVNWHVLLLNTKGPTPSGLVTPEHFKQLQHSLDSIADDEHVLIFCHHHPLPMNAYIDKHILVNGQQLLSFLLNYPQVRCVAHGHVHQTKETWVDVTGESLSKQQDTLLDGFRLMATPATSIQFKAASLVRANDSQGPAFRHFELLADGKVESTVIWLDQQ